VLWQKRQDRTSVDFVAANPCALFADRTLSENSREPRCLSWKEKTWKSRKQDRMLPAERVLDFFT
jgi:hypothetical protein